MMPCGNTGAGAHFGQVMVDQVPVYSAKRRKKKKKVKK
jgi:hypothetical protein